jgi:DNA topoisomerase-1
MAMAAPSDVEQSAMDALGLKRIQTRDLTIERVSAGGGFSFLKDGKKTVGKRDAKRISELVIPPAWSDVRIASDREAHLQAVGRDEAGRLQYIYHEAWEDVRAAAKASRLLILGVALPALRPTIDRDLKIDGPNLALATAARLVDTLHLRAGHESYAGDEGGRGVATLLKRHIDIDGSTFRLCFRGKGGKRIDKVHTDARLAEALSALRSIRGPRLFKIRSADGYRSMTASDLNRYLGESSGKAITAKDFRTLYASATALDLLGAAEVSDNPRTRNRTIAEVARTIASELANTPAITRKSYIHPLIIERFEGGGFDGSMTNRARENLTGPESKLMRFLEGALARKDA